MILALIVVTAAVELGLFVLISTDASSISRNPHWME